MGKKPSKVNKKVVKSTWEIQVDNDITTLDCSQKEAEKKYGNAKSREGSITYLYRVDYNSDGQVIEKYMVG